MKNDETRAYYGEFSADLCAGKHLIFIYTNIIENQYVGDVKAPLLRVIDSKQRLKNGSVCELEPTHRILFTILDYKKLSTNTIQSISIELRTKTGQLVPFSGTGKVILTFNNVLHSLFSDSTVSANGLKISNANENYAHKRFVETVCSHNKDAKNTWLACDGYSYEENPGALSTAEMNRWKALVRGSGECTFYGKVAAWIFLHMTKIFSVVLHSELSSDEQSITLF